MFWFLKLYSKPGLAGALHIPRDAGGTIEVIIPPLGMQRRPGYLKIFSLPTIAGKGITGYQILV